MAVQKATGKEITMGIDLGQREIDKHGNNRIAKKNYIDEFIRAAMKFGVLDGRTRNEIAEMADKATDAFEIKCTIIDEYFDQVDPLRITFSWEERETDNRGRNPQELIIE